MNTSVATFAHEGDYTPSIINRKTRKYVDLAFKYFKQSAKNILLLGKTIVEANEALSPDEFATFCQEIGIEKNSATFKKFHKIGSRAFQLEPFLEKLPTAWTTLYKLSTLQPDDLNVITSGEFLSPLTTAKQVDEYFGKQKAASQREAFDIFISTEELDEEVQAQVHEALNELREQFCFKMKGHSVAQNQGAAV